MALNSLQIHNHLKKDYYANKVFKGVLPRDKLQLKFEYPAAFVINSKPSSHSGEHWYAIYYNKNKEAIFFDSYGKHPSHYRMVEYLNRTSTSWIYNDVQLQGILTSTCGYYCVYFILFISRGLNLNDIINEFNKKDFNYNDFKISLL